MSTFRELLSGETQLDEAVPKIARRFDLTLINRRTTVEELKAHIEKTGEMMPHLLKVHNKDIKGDTIDEVTVFPKNDPTKLICVIHRQIGKSQRLVERVAKKIEYVFGVTPVSIETEENKPEGYYLNHPTMYVTKAVYSVSDVKKIKEQTKIVTDMIKEIE